VASRLRMRFHKTMKILWTSSRTVTLLLALLLLAALELGAAPAASNGKYILYVGTYTEGGSKSKGIYAYRYDPDVTPFDQITPLGLAAETTNPSWIALAPNGRFLYAVNEIQNYKGPNSGGLSAFA